MHGSRQIPAHFAMAIVAALALCAGSGCARPNQGNKYERYPAIVERTRIEFADALFYKPADDLPAEQRRMAPLIVQQIARGSADDAHPRIAGIEGSALTTAAATPPSIFVWKPDVNLPSGSRRQVNHLWCFARRNPLDKQLRPVWQGVRMTPDARGFPVIWEVLDDREPLAVIFIAKSLEAASAAAYGPPLPGRRFSIERGVDECPDVVVARLLDDGPEPMGPLVYLRASDLAVTTLLCRCMPAQYSNAVEQNTYRLAPSSQGAGESIDLPDDHLPDDSRRRAPDWLERALRLPPQF
jgi:hypothetical protein